MYDSMQLTNSCIRYWQKKQLRISCNFPLINWFRAIHPVHTSDAQHMTEIKNNKTNISQKFKNDVVIHKLSTATKI